VTINHTLGNGEEVFLRIIGDVHGKHRSYLRLVQDGEDQAYAEPEHSIQIGDFGFDYKVLAGLDPERHKVLGGNHDNYDKVGDWPHFLGDFGVYTIPDFGDIFFVRGAWSIDQSHRTIGIDWWEQEELTLEQGEQALKLYEEVKPDFVISHECPINVVPHVTDPGAAFAFGHKDAVIKTRTSQLLQAMTSYHQPKIHFFGHYHRNVDICLDNSGFIKPDDCPLDQERYFTRYVCLGELRHVDLDKGFLKRMRE